MAKHKNTNLIKKFHDGYIPEPMSGCWLWTGRYRSNCGDYGFICIGNGAMESAHRFAYSIYNGALIHGHHIHHKCENQSCVNPMHLEQLSSEDHGKIRHSRSVNKTLCKKGLHLISDPQSYAIFKGSKVCLSCAKNNEQKLRESSRLGDSKCVNGHIFTNDNTYWNKRPGWYDRICKICLLKRRSASYVPKITQTEKNNLFSTIDIPYKCKRGHKLNNQNTYIGRRGTLTCSQCIEYDRARKHKV